ncbi:hypothetical protein G6O69_30405 [Pseudenhygromyxa sp. WMMC2535]|uniref:hypothetical protein n=1 Tax=Pseudenhygromyxa sp. WMMC2535 TaxID=2712867 RepID=UPI0015954965|nr:hypothetical protein [Pseudenhygromyxa sp. WMMC2535]NVB42174.1 hypothetical protein [Pseudenhygromyxa sp. WMMC2535]
MAGSVRLAGSSGAASTRRLKHALRSLGLAPRQERALTRALASAPPIVALAGRSRGDERRRESSFYAPQGYLRVAWVFLAGRGWAWLTAKGVGAHTPGASAGFAG